MGNLIDLTGMRFGRLLVTKIDKCGKHNQRYWMCRCDCGNDVSVLGYSLRNKVTKSCGCLKKESISSVNYKHGMSNSQIWSIHRSMMDRCYLSSSSRYSDYGGRGISVCDRWHDFENFYKDVGDKPKGLSLERIDNYGNYCPENVKWATAKEQANNRRSNVLYLYGDEELTIAQWAEKSGMCVGTVWARIKRGIPFPLAFLNIDLRYA